ncbi:MAG: RsmB/NOP family class I SAM-dependent RNA methyltransferase [Burkholderiales bacterium]|nr:RsmB/NOP family class I SAM-dependent RNA methyltransferase [Burkholderiales bacterium]
MLDATVAAATEVLRFDRPADRVLSAFFRSHRELGQHDRAFIAETVYALLRRKRLLASVCGVEDPRRMVLAALLRLRGFSARELAPLVAPAEAAALAGMKAAARGELDFAVACDLPDWIVARLEPALGRERLARLADALNRPAPLDLRVNLQKSDRDTVLARLAAEGIAAAATPYSPVGVRLAAKPALARHPLFLEGAVEVQDEGSQLLAYLVAPRRGEMVVDFCAGAGGKALALGALMRSTGRVYAFDVSDRRLAELKPRLARSGLSNVHPQRIASERDPRVKRLAGKIDRVLVDAPCSGLGTLRRNPDLKWRQKPADVERMAREQASILAAAAALVKPGGRLVYATCSLLREENEDVVAAFLAAHPEYALRDAGDALREARIALPRPGGADPFLRLDPEIHGTDGFFAAVLERRAAAPAGGGSEG